MISINSEKDCCGCSACVQICPQKCIELEDNSEGFYYPKVNASDCINCHLCEKVCPFLNIGDSREYLSIFAAKNTDDVVRLQSSSGGIFSLIAENVIEKNGVVFGAVFDQSWQVCHSYTEKKDGLERMRGSKYVQSNILNTYKETKHFLDGGRIVLFSGTPCQIAGLKRYLSKDYINLITVDLVCHGVPSPLVFKEYLNSFQSEDSINIKPSSPMQKKTDILKVSFRDKSMGWQRYGFSIQMSENNKIANDKTHLYFEDKNSDPYLKGFISNLFLRPSCYTCPIKKGNSGADITLSDYWGINSEHPDFFDDKGVSCIIAYTEKGLRYLHNLKLEKINTTMNKFVIHNPSYYKSFKEPTNRKDFWISFHKDGVLTALNRYTRMTVRAYLRSFPIRLISKLRRILLRLKNQIVLVFVLLIIIYLCEVCG